ncbi:MAG: hypothetical protein Q7S65_03170 [Nanoarchaeota archaeon]|nr:hypothetical protein [Nanoarchaeota archaeon]
MARRERALASILAAATIIGVAATQKYSNFNLPSNPDIHRIDQADVAEKAKSYLGAPYSVDRSKGMVCTDVYVESAGLTETLIEAARTHPEQYSPFNERLVTFSQNIAFVAERLGVVQFDNTPENPQFPRRIQNVLSFQASNGTFTANPHAAVNPGYAVYFSQDSSGVPSHMGVVESVSPDGRPNDILHASSTAGKVIQESLVSILGKGYQVAGYGHLPLSGKFSK